MDSEARVVGTYGDIACISDKPVDRVIADVVRFADGSWANLLARSYGGGGRGRVFFVAVPRATGTSMVSRIDARGPIVNLALTGGCADVVVGQTDGDGIVELHGDAGFGEAVDLDVHDGSVSATWHACADGSPRLFRCAVARGCRVSIEMHGRGHIWIAAARELTAALGGEASLVCERAEGLDLDVNGSGPAFIASAGGAARVRANASGSLIVAGGELDTLDAAVRSTGSVIVDADVGEALLSNTGSGTLDVRRTRHRICERHAGPGAADRG